MTSLGSGPTATNKRHSMSDKMHFPRASLQPITTLGMWPCFRRLGNGLRWLSQPSMLEVLGFRLSPVHGHPPTHMVSVRYSACRIIFVMLRESGPFKKKNLS